MPLTYKDAKGILAQYAGKAGICPEGENNKQLDLFVRKTLEYMLISGEYGNIRKFCFQAVKGCFTVPYELEVPLKIKIDNCVGTAWDKWFEYHQNGEMGAGCVPAGNALFEEPNYYPIVYDLPANGARVGVLGICKETEDAHVIVQGTDTNGREVYTVTHKGEKIVGEYLRIRKGEFRYSQTTFAQVSHVTKTITNGYVQLLWAQPEANSKGFLADYSPIEEKPEYRRYRITAPCGASVKVSVLGRIRLKSAYMDNDYIPFDNLYTLDLAGQAINANYNSDPQTAAAKDQQMTTMIDRKNNYNRVQSGIPVEFFHQTSAGAIKNII